MFFNSIDFAIFLPIVFVLYWFVTKKNLKLQNALIVIASYIFYGWWDWKFLSLIIFSTFIDFLIGLQISKEENPLKRKVLLWTSISINLGFLGFFKYYNFFLENFVQAFSFFGTEIDANSLSIILPVGISFYTFQTMSYTIDIYKRKLEPTKDFIAFAAFVSFFPQLVAGPIERASNLLPQFYKKRKFDYSNAKDGMRQIVWGLFKKVVIADNCATVVNYSFENMDTLSGYTLILAAVLFAFQIYGDFSGYSDIAIGTSRLFGFNLKKNFSFPYFSRNIGEFWRSWHISLSTWFRDYLYIPLGGSIGSTWKKVRNTFIIFLVSGFWHGANWTFIFWGLLNAIYFLPLLLRNKNRIYIDNTSNRKVIPSIKELLNIFITFLLTVIAWVFFRSNSIGSAFNYFSNIIHKLDSKHHLFETVLYLKKNNLKVFFLILIFFLTVEWINKNLEHGLKLNSKTTNIYFRWSLYTLICLLIIFWGGKQQGFIYFQF